MDLPILTGLLTKEQQQAGMHIQTAHGDRLALMHVGEIVMFFDEDIAIQELQDEAYQHLEWHKSGVDVVEFGTDEWEANHLTELLRAITQDDGRGEVDDPHPSSYESLRRE